MNVESKYPLEDFRDFDETELGETQEEQPVESLTDWYGPEFLSILKFLSIPGIFLMFVLIGVIPRFGLYVFAAIYGVFLLARTAKNPEYLMAVAIFYIPLASVMPVSIVTGLNATNIFLLTLIVVALFDRKPVVYKTEFGADSPLDGEQVEVIPRGTRAPLLKAYIVWTAFSGVTAMTATSVGTFLGDHLLTYKGWVDQGLLIFVFAALIKDSNRAVRVVIYMMLASMVVTLLGLQEHIDKWGVSNIEKARVVGNSGNPNDFGGFLVYTFAPFVGISIAYLWRFKILIPIALYASIWARVLVATFSRGAYMALAAGLAGAGYIKGIRFAFASGFFVLLLISAFPSLVPDAILDRLNLSDTGHDEMLSNETSRQQVDNTGGLQDKSSMMRFIVWDAAIEMTKESPVFGKGFKRFNDLSSDYTSVDLNIADPHNMYLYLSSQMGVPAVAMFVLLFVLLFFKSDYLQRHHPDRIVKGIAIGGGMVAASLAVTCMFGSRMVSIETCGLAWIYVIVINRFHQDLKAHELRQKRHSEEELWT